eukprot:357392-Chlamydomonas_euryale.AAC.25
MLKCSRPVHRDSTNAMPERSQAALEMASAPACVSSAPRPSSAHWPRLQHLATSRACSCSSAANACTDRTSQQPTAVRRTIFAQAATGSRVVSWKHPLMSRSVSELQHCTMLTRASSLPAGFEGEGRVGVGKGLLRQARGCRVHASVAWGTTWGLL